MVVVVLLKLCSWVVLQLVAGRLCLGAQDGQCVGRCDLRREIGLILCIRFWWCKICRNFWHSHLHCARNSRPVRWNATCIASFSVIHFTIAFCVLVNSFM